MIYLLMLDDQVIVDLCHAGNYQSEYLKHAPCMRKAQTEYESCADDYQLRIKALNKVRQTMMMVMMMIMTSNMKMVNDVFERKTY